MSYLALPYKAVAAGVLAGAARLLFPPVCPVCARHVAEPGSLCGACWPSLRFLEEPWCAVLGTPFPHDHGEGAVSAAAIADPPPFDRARSAVLYTGAARKMVQDLKYHDRTDLAPWMARWMMRPGRELLAEADVIVPVPLHARRFIQRRFNQSAELARPLAKLAGKPFGPSLLLRTKATLQQVGLRQTEREDNVRAAFSVPKAKRRLVAGRAILVVDDVYTTGATLRAVATTLKRAGASRVDVLTFARVLPGDFQPDD